MDVSRARASQAAEICDIVRRSIRELCLVDHRDDMSVLDAWLQGKTPERVRQWILNPSNDMFVAKRDRTILGVGCVRGSDVILNYVAPEARFQGVSTAILVALEQHVENRGLIHIELESTATALQFYLSRGYRCRSQPVRKFEMDVWPLIKDLRSAGGPDDAN